MGGNRVVMRRLVDRWSISVILLFLLMKALQLALKLGIRRKEDSWRRCMAPFFQTEHAKFTIAAFGLDFTSDLAPVAVMDRETSKQHIIGRLGSMLKRHPEVQWKQRWGLMAPKRSGTRIVDIIHAVFDDRKRLSTLEPYLDPSDDDGFAVSPHDQTEIIGWICEAYNDTVLLPDKRRPAVLARMVNKRQRAKKWSSETERINALHYAERLMTGTYIQFDDTAEGPQRVGTDRFSIPPLDECKHPGSGLFNVRYRFFDHYREADLWFEVNHVLVDGAIVQDLIKDLKREWGMRSAVKTPSLAEAGRVLHQYPRPGEKKTIYRGRQLIDFRNFFNTKKELSQRYGRETGGDVTLASMIAWGLAQTSVFTGIKFLIPVDTQSPRSRERTLSHVVIRPQFYFSRTNPLAGFVTYQQAFNRMLKAAKEGRGEIQEMMDAFALNPPLINSMVYKLIPSAVHELFGLSLITLLKESELFTGMLDDIHRNGCVAFGSMTLTTENDEKAGWVTAIAEKDVVESYLDSVSDVVSNFSKYLHH